MKKTLDDIIKFILNKVADSAKADYIPGGMSFKAEVEVNKKSILSLEGELKKEIEKKFFNQREGTNTHIIIPLTEEIEEPEIRWNIIEDEGYMGDEWDNWQHMNEEERNEYFKKVFSYFKSLKDQLEEGKQISLDEKSIEEKAEVYSETKGFLGEVEKAFAYNGYKQALKDLL